MDPELANAACFLSGLGALWLGGVDCVCVVLRVLGKRVRLTETTRHEMYKHWAMSVSVFESVRGLQELQLGFEQRLAKEWR